MKGFVLAVALATMPLTSALADSKPKPKPPKAMKTAVECVLEAVAASAYDTMTPEQLADYCIDLAIRVHSADYSPPERK